MLADPQPAGCVLGAQHVCVVTVLNDEGGLPEKLRVAWSKLRFPDARRLRQGLNEGGVRVCDMLAQLLADQVREFYAHKHRDSLERLMVTRDICQQRVSDLEAEVRSAEMRQSVVEEATRLQARMQTISPHGDGRSTGTLSNITSTIRLKGHLYNRHLLERALDIIESHGGLTHSVGEPVMGGSRSRPSSITIRVDNVRGKEDMEEIIERIREVFAEAILLYIYIYR